MCRKKEYTDTEMYHKRGYTHTGLKGGECSYSQYDQIPAETN